MIEVIVLTIYMLIALGVLVAIRLEADKQGVPFNWIQLVIALFWFAWIGFYLYAVLKEKFRKK